MSRAFVVVFAAFTYLVAQTNANNGPIVLFPSTFAFCNNGDRPLRVPDRQSVMVQCGGNVVCPPGYGCVIGPTATVSMSVCCPIRRNPPAETTVKPSNPFIFVLPFVQQIQKMTTKAPTTTVMTTTTTSTTTSASLPEVIQPATNWCFTGPETGPCFQFVVAYYYQADKQRCMPFAYGGCVQHGNGWAIRPPFTKQADCEQVCKLAIQRMADAVL